MPRVLCLEFAGPKELRIVGSSDGRCPRIFASSGTEFAGSQELRTPSLVLKNSEGSVVLWTANNRNEPNPRWCSVAVCCPCGGRQRGNGCELRLDYLLNANRQRQATVADLQGNSSRNDLRINWLPSKGGEVAQEAVRMPLSKNPKMVTPPPGGRIQSAYVAGQFFD